MPKFEVLYYPNFEPPAQWFRSYLLFFDKIRTIVPDDIDFKPSDDISEIVNLIPNSFETISPKEKDVAVNDFNLDRMRKAFQFIKEQEDNNTIEITIFADGKMQIAGHTFLYNSKLSDKIYNLLNDFGLIKDEFQSELKTGSIDFGEFYIVNTKAADLIVSQVADRIGSRYGWNMVTDHNIDFLVNALNNFDWRSIENPTNMLVSSIINCEIPQEVQCISPKKYQELRDAYSDIREPFHHAIIDLSNLYLEAIEDKQTLQKRIIEITSEFDSEVKRFKKSNFGKTIKRWMPIGIGGLASLTGAAFAEPKIAITSAAVSVVIQVVQEMSTNQEPQPERMNVQRLIAKMQKDILKQSEIRNLV